MKRAIAFAVCCFFAMVSMAQTGFISLTQQEKEQQIPGIDQNTAEVIFIANGNDLIIESSRPSIDQITGPQSIGGGMYTYTATLKLRNGSDVLNDRKFVVRKQGTSIIENIKKMVFKGGYRYTFRIEAKEECIAFSSTTPMVGGHPTAGEVCVEFRSPLTLAVEGSEGLQFRTIHTNSSGLKVTRAIIEKSSIAANSVLYVFTPKSNKLEVMLGAIEDRKKWSYDIVLLMSNSNNGAANEVGVNYNTGQGNNGGYNTNQGNNPNQGGQGYNTNQGYNNQGYGNNQGYNNNPYNNGYSQNYNQNNQGYNQNNQGYNNQGYNQNNQGYNNQGYNQNNQGYNNQGYNQNNQGYNQNNQGYNQNNQGYNNQGYGQNNQGYNQNNQGYNQNNQGYNQNNQGYNQNNQGYNNQGYSQNNQGYNQSNQGYNNNNQNNQPQYNNQVYEPEPVAVQPEPVAVVPEPVVEPEPDPSIISLTLQVEGNAEIWLNGSKKANGTYSSTFGPGTYQVETRKGDARSEVQNITISAADNGRTITLTPPPAKGSLVVNCIPTDATFYIDNIEQGVSPKVINNVEPGNHVVRIVKQGYIDHVENVYIVPGQQVEMRPQLTAACLLSISCNAPGAVLFLDGKQMGDVRNEYSIATGNYQLLVRANGYDDYSTVITATAGKQKVDCNLNMQKGNRTIHVGNVSFTMVYVEGGTFQMGATPEQGNDAPDAELPVHSVTLDNYFIGETEVTQELWEAVMGENPSEFKGSQRPVETISYRQVQFFIEDLNEKTGLNFRLPTEAEWEYAARGGNKSNTTCYAGGKSATDVAWIEANSGAATHPVKGKLPNELGLYDMSGNVWEWCSDYFDDTYYKRSETKNPKGPAQGNSRRTNRGGSWHYDESACNISRRTGSLEVNRSNEIGFRLAL